AFGVRRESPLWIFPFGAIDRMGRYPKIQSGDSHNSDSGLVPLAIGEGRYSKNRLSVILGETLEQVFTTLRPDLSKTSTFRGCTLKRPHRLRRAKKSKAVILTALQISKMVMVGPLALDSVTVAPWRGAFLHA